MPIYEFCCERCQWHNEFMQSILLPLPITCPQCGEIEPDFHQVYDNDLPFCIDNVQTLGQLADRNSKRIGKDEVEERTIKNKQRVRQASDKLLETTGAKPMESKTPWWRSGEDGMPKLDKPLSSQEVDKTAKELGINITEPKKKRKKKDG
jgi:putative FmdB family regulatory protein